MELQNLMILPLSTSTYDGVYMVRMVRLRVKERANRIGIINASQLSRYTGINLQTCYKLWDGTLDMIGVSSTLNTLCNRLRATPADLIEFRVDDEIAKRAPDLADVLTSRRGRKRLKAKDRPCGK
jgi:DNA-binding Xre family transcriptional regulator